MDPDTKALLDRLVKLSEENNKILRKLRRAAFWGMVWDVIKILIIVVPIVAGIVIFRPYLLNLIQDYSQIQKVLNMPLK